MSVGERGAAVDSGAEYNEIPTTAQVHFGRQPKHGNDADAFRGAPGEKASAHQLGMAAALLAYL